MSSKPIIAVLGPKGTFSELAAIKFFQNKDSELIYLDTIDDVFEYVSNTKNEVYGVVPIENSIEGGVNLTIDCFIDYDVKIFGEIILDINLFMLSKGSIEKIKKIYSHPHALAQCRKFLRKFPNLKIIPCESTAKACEIVANDHSSGAIASKEAAEIYKLKILYENIQDYKSQTRFTVICKKEKEENFKNNKTSLIFYLEDKPGALYSVLKEFAERSINLKKIESRPSKRILGEYFFFVEVEGNLKQENLKIPIENIKNKVKFLKILGSY